MEFISSPSEFPRAPGIFSNLLPIPERPQRNGTGGSDIERIDSASHRDRYNGVCVSQRACGQAVSLGAKRHGKLHRWIFGEDIKRHGVWREGQCHNAHAVGVERRNKFRPLSCACPGNLEHRSHTHSNAPPVERIGAGIGDDNGVGSDSRN